MPRVAPFKIDCLADLYRQLEYAPQETRRREMDAAERLLEDIDPEMNYPEEFVVYRITNFRPNRADEPVTLVGAALVPDLVNLVQRLSDGLDLPPDYAGRRAIMLEQAAQRMSVSSKTIQRYRQQGLVCHYVVTGEDGAKRLACFEDALTRFQQRHSRKVAAAAAFTRVESEVADGIVAEAHELHRREGLTLNETARRLAADHARSHETVRAILRRFDRRAETPIFSEHGPLTDRDLRLVHRAWRWGVSAGDLAARFGKTRATVYRAINRVRGQRLRSLDVRFVTLSTFEMPDAAAVILTAPPVSEALDSPSLSSDALELIEQAHGAAEPASRTIDELLAGFNYLKHRARRRVDGLAPYPRASVLDEIETDLRWAGRLERKLARLAFPVAVRTIEQHLHRPLGEQPGERIVHLILLGVREIARTIERIDPARQQRFDRLCAFAVDRALGAGGAADDQGRAAARHDAQTLQLGDPFDGLVAWERLLEPSPRLRRHLDRLDAPAREIVAARYGWGGRPPQTVAAIAESLGAGPGAAARLLGAAERRLRRLARAGAAVRTI
jgi:predicted DNA-binding transcriptional regulator YafY